MVSGGGLEEEKAVGKGGAGIIKRCESLLVYLNG
jgi:hypothetical protein